MSRFSRLVNFLAKDGKTYYGDAILPAGITDIGKARKARIINGSPLAKYEITDRVEDIRMLLTPLRREDIRTVRCLGLNYREHAFEAKMPIPKYPVLFYKPVTAVSGPFDPIPVPLIAQDIASVDYECELIVVIGKQARDVSAADALDYVLGYAVSNDVSHREWQQKRGGGQWNLGKGFDGWAPMGPGIVSTDLIKDPNNLRISTKVNGETVQDNSTQDMIFNVRETISFLSRGTTLLPGDLILTGTPQGVGMGKNPPLWLKDGDTVEVSLEGVGSCVNKVEFEKPAPKL